MTATKLTKTQREVLERAAKNSKGRVYVQEWSQGSKGGGVREHNAIKQLVAMGLLTDYHVSHNDGYTGSQWNHPTKIYSSESTAFITEVGRQAL